MSKFKMTSHKVFYGTRAIPFTLLAEVGECGAGIPLEIDSVADLDLDAIKREIRRTVFKQSWSDLTVKHTPERVIAPEGMDPITLVEQIVVFANGINIVYAAPVSGECNCPIDAPDAPLMHMPSCAKREKFLADRRVTS